MSRRTKFLGLSPLSREKRFQRRLSRLQKRHRARQQRLRHRMEKRRRAVRGGDHHYWRVKNRHLSELWRENRKDMPDSLRQRGELWWRGHFRSRNYLALLRLYLVLLAARDGGYRQECRLLLERPS